MVGIRHLTCSEDCPNLCSNEWSYFDDGGFNNDASIQISCSNDISPLLNDIPLFGLLLSKHE